MTELTQFNAALKAMENKIPTVVVSLGTGIPPREDMNASHYDLSMPAGLMDIVTKVPKIKALMNLLVDQATQTEGIRTFFSEFFFDLLLFLLVIYNFRSSRRKVQSLVRFNRSTISTFITFNVNLC